MAGRAGSVPADERDIDAWIERRLIELGPSAATDENANSDSDSDDAESAPPSAQAWAPRPVDTDTHAAVDVVDAAPMVREASARMAVLAALESELLDIDQLLAGGGSTAAVAAVAAPDRLAAASAIKGLAQHDIERLAQQCGVSVNEVVAALSDAVSVDELFAARRDPVAFR
jgi:NACalpha-BTF3-like transcription factor